MTVFPFAIVGFDLDGTLVDTSGDLTAAVNYALGLAGRPPLTPHEVEPMIGGGAKHMLQQALAADGSEVPTDEGKRLYRAMLAYYEEHVSVLSRPYPGAINALDLLAARGVRLGVVTNKFERLARKLLGDLGLLERFGTLLGGDTLGKENAKPSGAPVLRMMDDLGGGRTAFIGDSRYDIQAARNAGVTAIAVGFGFPLEPVEALGADAVLDDYANLLPLLERLG